MIKLRLTNCLLLIAVAGTLLTASPLFAQFRSSIEGTVTDTSGAVVAGAQVVLSNQDTAISQTSTSNDTGVYRFPGLGPGNYTLTTTKAGFETFKQQNITLAAEETRTVRLTLKIGQTQEVVTVTTEAAAVQLVESKISSDITSKEISQLPLSGRNVFNLVSQTPGV